MNAHVIKRTLLAIALTLAALVATGCGADNAVLSIDATVVDTETHIVYAIHEEGSGPSRRSCMSARYDESGQLTLDTSVEPKDGKRFVTNDRWWTISTETDENGVLWLIVRKGSGKNTTMAGCALLNADGSAQTQTN